MKTEREKYHWSSPTLLRLKQILDVIFLVMGDPNLSQLSCILALAIKYCLIDLSLPTIFPFKPHLCNPVFSLDPIYFLLFFQFPLSGVYTLAINPIPSVLRKELPGEDHPRPSVIS